MVRVVAEVMIIARGGSELVAFVIFDLDADVAGTGVHFMLEPSDLGSLVPFKRPTIPRFQEIECLTQHLTDIAMRTIDRAVSGAALAARNPAELARERCVFPIALNELDTIASSVSGFIRCGVDSKTKVGCSFGALLKFDSHVATSMRHQRRWNGNKLVPEHVQEARVGNGFNGQVSAGIRVIRQDETNHEVDRSQLPSCC